MKKIVTVQTGRSSGLSNIVPDIWSDETRCFPLRKSCQFFTLKSSTLPDFQHHFPGIPANFPPLKSALFRAPVFFFAIVIWNYNHSI